MPRPVIRYFVSGEKEEISSGSPLWDLPLLNHRQPFFKNRTPQKSRRSGGISVGEYLSAAARFLAADAYAVLRRAVQQQSQTDIQTDSFAAVSLSLEKHGAFYHPIKVTADMQHPGPGPLCFVLNGAVSERGLGLLEDEFRLISHLNRRDAAGYLPELYGRHIGEMPKGRIGFFLGQWFEGFREFHLTEQNGCRQMAVWEPDGVTRYEEEAAVFDVYRQAACILTSFYDSGTFEQIFPWHHAAGDFIIRQENGRFQVRLITVRGYRNLSGFDPASPEGGNFILPALLFFFINLTVRMRLDRLDGTGPPALVDETVLPFVVRGFFQGVDILSQQAGLHDLAESFTSFFRQFGLAQLVEIAETILEDYPVTEPEVLLIRASLEPHFKNLQECVKTL